MADLKAYTDHQGYTLLEMLVVITILGLAAAIAVPSITTDDHFKLDLAASAVSDALRFAREESRRTGITHGVSADVTTNQVRVFRLDESLSPNVVVFDIYHPVSKQLYQLTLGDGAFRGVTLDAVMGVMVGTCSDTESIAFDSRGVVRCPEPTSTRIDDARLELSLGDFQLWIDIDSYTGRVSIQ